MHRHSPTVTAVNVPTRVFQVRAHNLVFTLSPPINLDARWEGERFVLEYEPLNLLTYGKDEQEAYAAFSEMFEVVWEQIAEAKDEDLTEDARQLKATFRSLVRSVADRKSEPELE